MNAMNVFLASVERRAFRMALLATREPADAFDIVQDAMFKLVKTYQQHTQAEWPALFQRVLQNRIMDWHRHKKRSEQWFAPFKYRKHDDDDDNDTLDAMSLIVDEREQNPAVLLELAKDMDVVLKAVEGLPIRQQQAFLLRVWEGFDVATTALAMNCSEGSVKTHFYRATQSIKAALAEEVLCDQLTKN
jgi:RNA polymerase sigma-70 factor (ECF subfamily)